MVRGLQIVEGARLCPPVFGRVATASGSGIGYGFGDAAHKGFNILILRYFAQGVAIQINVGMDTDTVLDYFAERVPFSSLQPGSNSSSQLFLKNVFAISRRPTST